MEDTPPSDEYSARYRIWGLKPWLIDSEIVKYMPAFKDLCYEDLITLKEDYFAKENLSLPVVIKIMDIIEVVKTKVNYMDVLTAIVQKLDVGEYNVLEKLENLHMCILPSRFTPLIGPLSSKFVKLLALIYEVIPKVKKPGDRYKCKYIIYMLSLFGSRNETFKAKEIKILNQWIIRHRKEYFPRRRY